MRERLRIVDEIRIQDPKTRTLLEGTNLNGLNEHSGQIERPEPSEHEMRPSSL